MKKLSVATLLIFSLVAFSARPALAQSQAPTNDLENRIVKTLFSLPHYGVFDNLYFETSGSDVTLMGQALF